MGNTCTSCNCNNQEPTELLTVEHKVRSIILKINSGKERRRAGIIDDPIGAGKVHIISFSCRHGSVRISD
jgi:hypothetical protein